MTQILSSKTYPFLTFLLFFVLFANSFSSNFSCSNVPSNPLSDLSRNADNGDLLGSIMEEQIKTLAPSKYLKVDSSKGTIVDTEGMQEYRKKIDEKLSRVKAFKLSKVI